MLGGEPMANMNLIVSLADEPNKVTVTLLMNGEPLGHITLDPTSAEQHANSVLRHAAACKMAARTMIKPPLPPAKDA